MLPTSSRGRVYINPNFKTTHINPKFLRNGVPNSIHINPAFLETQKNESSCDSNNTNNLPLEELFNKTDYIPNNSSIEIRNENENSTEAKIIPKSRTKLIRASNSSIKTLHKENNKTSDSSGQLLKIGLRKLIRSSIAMKKESVVNRNFPNQNTLRSLKFTNLSTNNLKTPLQKYKIDRRINVKPANFLNRVKKKLFVSQFALSRNNMNLTPKKVVISPKKIMKNMLPTGPNISSNLKLELLNINGVLYRSTKTKLQRSTVQEKQKSEPKKVFSNMNKKSTGDRILFVRGNKFSLDKTGLKLTKIQPKDAIITPEKVNKSNMKRIDIGGLTYIAKSNNVFVRTDIHVTRNYLSTTKQRSINTLHNRMVKTNIPCPIYRKLGKCAAFEKGKCPKLHEKKQIAICSKFLKGECSKSNCLLSHNVNFSKMPTCKFFLQGCCLRDDCPYLHKKLGKSVEICPEFLKGFCALAEKCTKRHEFLCPDFESKGKCEKMNCIYCKKRIKETMTKELKSDKNENKKKKVSVVNIECKQVNKESDTSRYFIENNRNGESYCTEIRDESVAELTSDDESNSGSSILKRPKLGKLPAFIPL